MTGAVTDAISILSGAMVPKTPCFVKKPEFCQEVVSQLTQKPLILLHIESNSDAGGGVLTKCIFANYSLYGIKLDYIYSVCSESIVLHKVICATEIHVYVDLVASDFRWICCFCKVKADHIW